MRLGLVLGVVGRLLRLFSPAFLAPLALAVHDGDWRSAAHFSVALALAYASGTLLGRGFSGAWVFRRVEALGVVALTWLVIGQFAAVPYVLAGLSPVDALFESISGFTTTGATILGDFSAHGRAFFLWRAMTQWFGGLGVIALFVAVLPRLGIAGRQLFFAEASGAAGESLAPHIRETALRLWVLYALLTAAQATALVGSGMGWYEALCHALTTLPAGGFSPHPHSLAGYPDPATQWIVVPFMLISGTSFTLLYKALTGRPQALLKDGEFLAYGLAATLGALGVAAVQAGGVPGWEELRHGAFQAGSLISSTGFASTDYETWKDGAKAILVVVMLVGGCAGSAAGGAKVIRYLLVVKFLGREVTRVLHPHAVIPVRHKGHAVPETILRAVFTLVALFLAGYVLIAVALVVLGADLVTGFSAALACLGNIGPGLGAVGPMGSYGHLSAAQKLVLTLAMWIGRLEIVTVLALLHPDVWRNLRWRGRAPAGAPPEPARVG